LTRLVGGKLIFDGLTARSDGPGAIRELGVAILMLLSGNSSFCQAFGTFSK